MSKKLTFILIVSLMLCLPIGVTQAAYLSVTPTGSFDATGPTITYDVLFNVGGSESFTVFAWEFDMVYDTLELSNPTPSGLPSIYATIFDTGTPGTLHNTFFSPFPGPTPPTTDLLFSSNSSYSLGSITFDLINPLSTFDSVADFFVGSQIGNGSLGFGTLEAGLLSFGAVNGADVGSPVPIPATMLLFGSSIVGIIGLRRSRRG